MYFAKGSISAVDQAAVEVEQLGDPNLAYVTLPGGATVVVRSEGDAKVREGDQMPAGLDAAQCHLFNASGIAFQRVMQ